MRFHDFPLHADLLRGLDAANFSECTKVQEATISRVIIEKRDVTVQSQTGTGKTAAFLVPIFQALLAETIKSRRALVIAPTRELAVQIAEEAELLGKFLPYRVACVYGGVSYTVQEKALEEGAELVIGTPGRILDFVQSKKINLKDFGIAVIDEADRLLDMGFYPDIKRIISKLLPPQERTTMLLSATISLRVGQIAWEHMNDPVEVVMESENITVDLIEQRLYHVGGDEKISLLLGILKKDKIENALIFTNTKRKAEELARRLELNNLPARFIMGDLPQKKRLTIINEMKEGKVKFLVATDVAARGLHIDDLPVVVNYDLPEDAENYVHRIGRTARAGKSGLAISFACERFVHALEGIEKYISRKIPVVALSDDIFAEDASKGVRIRLDVYDGDEARNSRSGPRKDRTDRPPRERTPRKPQGQETRTREGPRDPAQRQPRAEKPRGTMTEAERLEFYKKKYGEGFAKNPEQKREQTRTQDKPGQRTGQRPQQARSDKPRGTENQGQNRQGQNRNQNQNRNQGQRPNPQQKPPVQPAAAVQAVESKPAVAEKKDSIFGRIASLFRKK